MSSYGDYEIRETPLVVFFIFMAMATLGIIMAFGILSYRETLISRLVLENISATLLDTTAPWAGRVAAHPTDAKCIVFDGITVCGK